MKKYEIKKLISSQGQIWQIEEKKTKKLFAMKTSLNDDDVQNEYKNIKILQHCPFICRVHDAFIYQHDNFPEENFGLVMSLYKQDLHTRIQFSKKSKKLWQMKDIKKINSKYLDGLLG